MLVIKAKRINLLHIFGIVGVGLILTIPAIFHGVFAGDDLVAYHLKWSKHFSEQFWLGDLYPRWLLKMNAGLGSPTFFFYAPIPYYFTSLFHPLFADDPYGWYQLSLSTSLALIASGLTAYIWLKNITNQNSALIASILYMALPYHLAVDLYSRFAFAEYWTFVWIPLILYFSQKIISDQKITIIGFAVSYALLIMTHLPTLIIFSPVTIGYILLMSGRRQRKKALSRMLVAMILGVGLSAIYWLPAMTTQEYISMSAIREGAYFYANNFLFSELGDFRNSLWKYLEVMTLLMGGLACCAFISARTNSIATFKRESNYWIVIAMIALFMTLPLSKSVWDVLPVVQRIQFPWRFNTVLTVATTALVALGISAVRPVKFFNKKLLAIVIMLSASLLLSGIILIPVQQKTQVHWVFNTVLTVATTAALVLGISSLKKPVNFSTQKHLVIGILLVTILLLSSGVVIITRLNRQSGDVDTALEISMDASEYRPRWVPEETFDLDTVSQLGRNSTKAQVNVGQGSLLIQRWQPREIVLQTNATTNIWLTINQFYYPGWTARLNGESQVLPVQPSKPEGLLRLGVPSGKHEVIVTLDAGVEERVAQIISAISAVIALFLSFWFRQSDRDNVSYD